MQEIKATPISFMASSAKHIIWRSSSSGNFDLKEAYKLACLEDEGWSSVSFNGEWIWKVSTIPKIQCFTVLYGNASSKAYWSVECSLPGDWIYLMCVPYVMMVLKPLLMLLGIAEKPKFFGTP